MHWYQAIAALRPAFSRRQTFLWFIVCVAGMSVRSDNLGVSSIVRALALNAQCYNGLRRCYHSAGIQLTRLSALWTRTVLRLFAEKIERVNGRPVLLADGKKNAKAGKKMPAVKHLHQDSESNTKPAFIMGHSTQAVSILARAASILFAVPLDIKIHEGLIFSNRDKRTLLDKLLGLVNNLQLNEPCYLVADAYYASGKMVKGALAQGHELVTRAKSNCVAYHRAPLPRGKRPRGRPKRYGRKVKLSPCVRIDVASS
jgi:DDE superfamily endonuclease